METTAARSEVAATVRALMGRGVGDGKRVTQEQLAEVLGMSQGPMSRRLAGLHPFDFDELLAIAEFFNVSIASLIRQVDERRRPTDDGNRLPIWETDTDRLVSLARAYDVALPLELDIAA